MIKTFIIEGLFFVATTGNSHCAVLAVTKVQIYVMHLFFDDRKSCNTAL